MSVTLAAAVSASSRRLTLSAAIAGLVPHDLLRIEDELVEFQGFQTPLTPHSIDLTKIVANRGAGGTTAASHSSSVAVVGAQLAVVVGADQAQPLPFPATAVATGSGAPTDAPVGTLPVYLDGADLYVWDGAAWQGPYTTGA